MAAAPTGSRWPIVSIALGVAFAWGPAIDLVTQLMRMGKSPAGSAIPAALALGAVVARFGIARFAFATGSFGRAFFRLPPLTFALGTVLRLIALAPLWATAAQTDRGTALLQSAAFVPFLVASYAALLPQFMSRPKEGSTAELGAGLVLASLWVALPQLALSYFGLWSLNWKPGSLGGEWKIRFILGVILPLLAAIVGAMGSRRLHGQRSWRSAVLAWIVFPLGGIVGLSGLAAVPLPFVPHPLVVANARARDGTQIVLLEIADDPYDVYLNVRRPDQPWTRYRLAYGDPLWAGSIDLGPGEPLASISAYGVKVAVLHENDELEKLAPMTGFVGIPRVINSPFDEHY